MVFGEAGKKRFKNGVRLLVWSGILAVVSVGGWLVYVQRLNRPPEPVAVRLVTVELGTIETTINESGTVELGGQQTLKSPAEGAVERVLVTLGDRVRSGQQLIVLRNPDRQTILSTQQLAIQKQELTLASNRQKVAEAAAKLKAYREEFQEVIKQRDIKQKTDFATKELEIREQELTLLRSRQKLKEAEEKVTSEQRKLKDLEDLDRRGFIPRNELQTQQEQVRAAESERRDAQLAVSTNTLKLQRLEIKTELIPPQLPEKAIAAQNELREAQLAVSTDIRELQRLQLDLQKSQQQLQESSVIAPISGKVLNIMVKGGDGVDRRTDLLTLGDPAQELVKLQLSTLNAAQIKLGQLTRISVIGPNPQIYTGRVQSLYPQATTGEKEGENSSSGRSNQAAVPATVKLDKPTNTLIPGSKVNVEIILQQRQNAIVLNTEAIQRDRAKPFVWVRDSQGKARKRSVNLGLEGLTTVEVSSGLQAGEQILLPPADESLEEGTPTIPQTNSDEPKK